VKGWKVANHNLFIIVIIIYSGSAWSLSCIFVQLKLF